MTTESQRSGAVTFWIMTVLGAAALVLVVVNMFLVSGNRTIQTEVNARQQYINQSIQLSRVNEYLARALAVAAVQGNDDQLRGILAQHGITVTINQPPAAAGGAPAAPAGTATQPAGGQR